MGQLPLAQGLDAPATVALPWLCHVSEPYYKQVASSVKAEILGDFWPVLKSPQDSEDPKEQGPKRHESHDGEISLFLDVVQDCPLQRHHEPLARPSSILVDTCKLTTIQASML